MIQPSSGINLESTVQSQNFSIEMNSSMFQMLTKNVYTNVVLAVIREWATNAIDACIDAGNPIKYDLATPTMLKPEFYVRDYGTGLSPNDIHGLFSALGASTKRESNKYNGTFGIGRLSGLAYANSFTVTSYYEGTQYSYVVSSNEGVPQLLDLGAVPTDELNGLKLSVTVKSNDITKFKDEVLNLFKHFDHLPNFINKEEIPSYKPILEGDGWLIEKSTYTYWHSTKAYAVMGNVPYIIDSDYFDDDVADLFNRYNVIIKVPLGAISITPGRESLNMDDRTISYLNKRGEAILAEIVDNIEKQMKPITGYFNIVNTYRSIVRNVPVSSDCIRFSIHPNDTKLFYGNISSLNTNLDISLDYLTSIGITVGYMGKGEFRSRHPYNNYIDIAYEDIQFLIADMHNGISEAIKAFREGNKRLVILRQAQRDKSRYAKHVIKCKEYLSRLGIPDDLIGVASDYYTYTPSSKSKQIVTSTINTVTLYPYGSLLRIGVGDTITKDNTDTYYYVAMNGFKGLNYDDKQLSALVRLVYHYKDNSINLIGLTKSAVKRISNDPRFIPIEQLLPTIIKEAELIDRSDLHSYCTIVGRRDTQRMDDLATLSGDVGNYLSRLKDFLDTYKYEETVNIFDIAEYYPEVKVIKPDDNMLLQQLFDKYPLLKHLIRYNVKIDLIQHYISLIQEKETI